ncbi:MAG: leucine-rich repeat protein [Bacteroidaceae bacterium]|nr:leucine-rich repeat protein [Bacteroidaceae bacterium]
MARYKEYGYDIKDGVGIIPEWEMEIKEEAFKGCKELKRIDIPQWVTKIGKDAFSCCG